MTKSKQLKVQGTQITILQEEHGEFISLTDMLKAKDGDFFISDCLGIEIQLSFWVFGNL